MPWATRGNARLDLLRLIGPPLGALAARPPAPAHRPPRLLLIRPDHVGDVLLTSPAVALLRRTYPSAHLTYLVGPWSVAVARHGPAVDRIGTLAFPAFTRRANANPVAPYALLLREAGRLRAKRFDAAVVFRPDDWWGALLALAAGIPTRIGAWTPETAPLLSHTLPASVLPSTGTGSGQRPHAAETALAIALRAIAVLGAPQPPRARLTLDGLGAQQTPLARDTPSGTHPQEDTDRLVFRVPDDAHAAAARLWTSSGLDGRQVVVLQPLAGAALKTWPIARWAALATRLSSADRRVVLIGAPDDRPALTVIRQVAEASPQPVHLPLLVGQPLEVSAALYARADILVAPDSGAAHLASAVGTPTVRLYGPARPDVFGPWPPGGRHAILQTSALACVPCDVLAHPPCGATREPACMLALDVSTVSATIERVLSHG